MAKFEKGKSGNPGGRPASPEKAQIRAALAGIAPGILKRLIEQAKNGDIQASKIILDRCVPPVKAVEEPVKIEIKKTWRLSKQAAAIQQAAYAGEISVSQASALITNLANQAKIIEASELEERLLAIEKSIGKNA